MLSLQAFEPEDIPRLISWIPDEKFLMQWAGPNYHFPLDEKQLMETYAGTQGEQPSQYMFKLIHGSSQDVIGHLQLLAVDYEKKTAVLARVLVGSPKYRGQGIGEKMIKLGLTYGFEILGLDEIDLGVFDFNQSALKCYEKLGFQEYKSVKYETSLSDEFSAAKRMKLRKEDWIEGER